MSSNSLLFLLLLAIPLQVVSSTVIPDQFFGAWKIDRSEKFDEYLSAQGVNWFARKMIMIARITKIFNKKADGTYTVINLTSKADLKWENIHLDKEFEGKGLDGTIHKITFGFSNGQLTERHIRTYEGKQVDETYSYTVQNDELVMKLTAGEIVAHRWFKKTDYPKE